MRHIPDTDRVRLAEAFRLADKIQDDVTTAFSLLAKALTAALHAVNTPEFTGKVAAYRASQQQFQRIVPAADYKYFQFQLWKEGVARYTEYRVALLAAGQYRPGRAFAALDDYTVYAQVAAALQQGILADLSGESLEQSQRGLFYAYGAAQALLLDTAHPHWQQRYLNEKFRMDIYLEAD